MLLQSTLLSHNVDAYKTFELVKYCHRLNKQKQNAFRNHDESSIVNIEQGLGVVIPELWKTIHGDEDDDDYVNVDKYKATDVVIVEESSDESAMTVVFSEEPKGNRNWQQCSIFVSAKKPNGLIVTIRKLHLRPGIDWLRLSINNGSFVREFSHININDERDSVAYVAHHGVLIEFVSGYSTKSTDHNRLELTLTLFREADLCRVDDEYDCGSFRCISNNFVCDGINNCGDGRDEVGCPMDNITNYLLISVTLVCVSLLIFICLCYRCCCQKRKPQYRKQYQYVKIRTSSIPTIKRRTSSIHSETEVMGRDNLRRIKMTHFGDSMPVLMPTAPDLTNAETNGGYGSTNNTYLHLPLQPYALQLGPSGQGFGLVSTRNMFTQPTTSTVPEHHTFPLPQPTYPMLHPQLFTPLAPSPPPPPYSPRDVDKQQPNPN